jgi:RHS repeat-associated protein
VANPQPDVIARRRRHRAPNYCWSYDAFGNRWQQYGSNQDITGGGDYASSQCQPQSGSNITYEWAQYASGNNQMSATTQSPSPGSVQHDASGDVTYDGRNSYLYNAEGQICAVSNTYNSITTMIGYVYDADGQRVAKGTITTFSCDVTTNGFQTQSDYVRDQAGNQLSEFTPGSGGSMVLAHTNVWANGVLIATDDVNKTHFYLNDWLGTRRVQTDYAGTLEQTCASLPYGDGETCGPAPTENLYTGKERDAESGNDYFGARYYASTTGRWLSPDWSQSPEAVPYATYADPQSLNLYNYMRDNPLGGIDPDGHGWWKDFFNGLANSTYRPLVTLVRHPIITGKAIGNLAIHPIATVRAMRSGIVTTSQQVMTGNGTAIGTVVGTVGISLIPGAGEAGDATEGVSDLSKLGEAAGDSGTLSDLNKSLASQEQMDQLAAGKGDPTHGAGTGRPLTDFTSQRLASEYGGAPGDWQKVRSGNYNPGGATGGGFETHAYQNVKTGQVVEMKTKFQ